MAHKSHRQKALQSQLEERPAISLITDDDKTKKSKTKKTKSTTAATTTASALASSSMDVDGEDTTQPQPEAQHVEDDDGDILLDNATASTSAAPAPTASTSSGFKPLNLGAQSGVLKNEFRRIPIPPHRITPLKRDWVNLYTPMVEHLGLQVRMNMQRRAVELKVSQMNYLRGSECFDTNTSDPSLN